MIRGTTPLHTFKFNEDLKENYSHALITYRQTGNIILQKECYFDMFYSPAEGMSVNENTLQLRLTANETMLFDEGRAYVQVKIFNKDDTKIWSTASFGFPVVSCLDVNNTVSHITCKLAELHVYDNPGFKLHTPTMSPEGTIISEEFYSGRYTVPVGGEYTPLIIDWSSYDPDAPMPKSAIITKDDEEVEYDVIVHGDALRVSPECILISGDCTVEFVIKSEVPPMA